jgi:preprotein translocase subunit SecA
MEAEDRRRAEAQAAKMQFRHPDTGSYSADEEAADVVEEQQRQARIAAASAAAASGAMPAVGRNEPCPCGSGKKYKHCHGQAS